jgi:hypothetical protein
MKQSYYVFGIVYVNIAVTLTSSQNFKGPCYQSSIVQTTKELCQRELCQNGYTEHYTGA